MSWRNSTVVGIAALTWGTAGFAATHDIDRGQSPSQPDAAAVPCPALRPDFETPVQVSPLEIAKVRLDSPRPWEIENSAVLKFQMSNGSSSTLTDILLEVAIVEESQREHLDTPRRILAGPFAIRGKTVLDPGDTADFEILLRNISPTCRCAAKVSVLSYRSKGGSGP
jgi:hypothetical protein